jgi:hypothetical protein
VSSPVAVHAIDDGTEIELCTEDVKHSMPIDAGADKSCLVNLKCMSMFGWFHGQVDNQLELDSLLVNLDNPRGKEMNI